MPNVNSLMKSEDHLSQAGRPLYLQAGLLGFLLAVGLLAGCGFARQANLPAAFPPSADRLLSFLTAPPYITFCGEPVPLATPSVQERFEKEMLLSVWDRPQVILWLKRAARFMPYIEGVLRQRELPDDLKYITIVESALQAHVGSSKGAVGFWQFLKATGQQYGLTINADIDERRNLIASTQAALRYFQVLYDMFDSWTLAAAAYNMGENGLKAEITLQGTNDFYQLHLPQETQRYVLKIVVAKLILSVPQRYGFGLAASQLYPPVQTDTVQLSLSQKVPLWLIAQAAQTSFKTIKDFNPELRGYYLREGDRALAVPKGAAAGFQERFVKLVQEWEHQTRGSVYTVQAGDSLSSIARNAGVPIRALLVWNEIHLSHSIHPGDTLIVYTPNNG